MKILHHRIVLFLFSVQVCGLKINRIFEINGYTDDVQNYTWIDQPDNMTAIETRTGCRNLHLCFYGYGGLLRSGIFRRRNICWLLAEQDHRRSVL